MGKAKFRKGPRRNPYQPVAPLFVPRTQEGKLVTRLREVQENLSKMGPKLMPRVKLVEEGGLMLKSILVSNPWKDVPCGHPQCSTCLLGESKIPGTCSIRSVVYQNCCIASTSKGEKARYVGETGRTMLERSKEHQLDALNATKQSHIWEHMSTKHPELSNLLSAF